MFYSLKGINELRRSALSGLKDKLIYAPVQNEFLSDCSGIRIPGMPRFVPGTGISFLIRTKDQLLGLSDASDIISDSKVSGIYFEEFFFCDDDSVRLIENVKHKTGIPVFAACSFIRRKGDDLSFIQRFLDSGLIDGLLVRNFEDLAIFGNNRNVPVISDFGLYAWNNRSANEFSCHVSGGTLPLELSNAECRDLVKGSDFYLERVVYGRAPLMISANCVRKTLKSCTKNSGFETIIDRKGISFPVYADCNHCLNVIYNSVPLIMKDETGLCGRVEFTTEGKDECAKLIKLYVSGSRPEGAHTSGWADRPVM